MDNMQEPSFAIDVASFSSPQMSSVGGAGSGYDALEPKGRRKSAPSAIVREDTLLKGGKRTRLQANANDINRNFSIAAWAIRRHLDYVASFSFHARTKDRGFNKELEELISRQSKKDRMDRGARFSREKLFRYAEIRRVIDNDVGLLLLQDRRTQAIEADLIRNPPKQLGPHEWVEGIQSDSAGKPLQYSISARSSGGAGYDHKRIVRAENFIHYGFFERAATDQKRGVSPLVASLNNYRDLYEEIEYALLKSKTQQLLILAMMREKDASPLDPPGVGGDDEVDEVELQPRKIDLTNGPAVVDLDENEKIDVVESKNPSNEFQNFTRLVTMIALKALDIPYSFFDEAHTNWSGQRTAWLHYERATSVGREDQIEMRCSWTTFQLARAIIDGDFLLPSGMTVEDVAYEWVPRGMPWWKPSEEIVGDLKAIASGLDSPISITKSRGTGDIYRNIDDLSDVLAYARDRGVTLNFDPGNFPTTISTGKD